MEAKPITTTIYVRGLLDIIVTVKGPEGKRIAMLTGNATKANFQFINDVMVKIEPNGCFCLGMRCVVVHPPGDGFLVVMKNRAINPGTPFDLNDDTKMVSLNKKEVQKLARTSGPTQPLSKANGFEARDVCLVAVCTKLKDEPYCLTCRRIYLPRAQSLYLPGNQ